MLTRSLSITEVDVDESLATLLVLGRIFKNIH